MRSIRAFLLGSVAGLSIGAGAQAADLAIAKVAPIEYVRVCTAFGAGFFYIPGTETCLRVSGRARYEAGYAYSGSRNGAGQTGDLSAHVGLMRLNIDARSQTDYGTLRAFLRLDAASRTGNSKVSVNTFQRIGNAFNGTGQDQIARVQNFFNFDKAFIQIAGLTAGRASSIFDFYASDYEIIATSLGSSLPSTNILAYTKAFGGGWSATISMEDPNYRKNPFFSDAVTNTPVAGASGVNNAFTTAPTPIILGVDTNGTATALTFIDAVQRSRMPDFVGSLRYDSSWGSAQLSAAVKDVNTGGFIAGSSIGVPGTGGVLATNTQAALAARGIQTGAQTDYGWAVQGGVKFNLPFIAPGDGFYLQGAYGQGANLYTGISRFTGSYASNLATFFGNPFNQYLSDAIVNPLTGRIDLTKSFTVVASFLHYWSPEWRSAFYGSYGELSFSKSARAAVSQTSALIGAGAAVSPPSYIVNPVGFALSPALRDTGQIVAGASLIWSPVKDLDIGVEGQYARTAVLSGRVSDTDRGIFVGGVPTRTVSAENFFQARLRVQRDF